jgi:hypothetical protein
MCVILPPTSPVSSEIFQATSAAVSKENNIRF